MQTFRENHPTETVAKRDVSGAWSVSGRSTIQYPPREALDE